MADTTTTNYGYVKPEIGGSDNTWGGKIHTNWDQIDADLKAVSNVANAITAAALLIANNLSDLGDVPTARSNLGLGALALLSVLPDTWGTPGTIAAAATTDLGSKTEAVLDVTGTGFNITSFGSSTNKFKILRFAGAGTIAAAAHAGTDLITVSANDQLVLTSNGAGAWYVVAGSGIPPGAVGGLFKGENGEVGQSAGDIFRVHEQTLNTNVTIDADENAVCAGPLTVDTGVTLTVASGGRLAIV